VVPILITLLLILTQYKMFLKFLHSLKTPKNQSLIEAIQQGYQTIFENTYPMAPEGQWYGEGTYKAAGGELISMSPDEFLSKAKPLEMDELTRENVDDLKQHIIDGGELDPLTLYEIDTNNVKASDGRHRAIASKELGIDKVPVVSYVNKTLTESESILYRGSNSQNIPNVSNSKNYGMLGNESNTTRHGIFLSDNKEFAQNFGQVTKYQMDTNNTLDMHNKQNWNLLDEFEAIAIKHNPELEKEFSDASFEYWSYFDDEIGELFKNFLQSKGYDSATFPETFENTTGNTFVIFNTNGITSI